MGQHTIRYLEVGPFEHTARCRCGWVPKDPRRTVAVVQDDVAKHLHNVERVRFHFTWGRPPTLTAQRDYYLERANNPDEAEHDRHLWKMLADELSYRVNDGPPTEEQSSLF